MHELPPEKLKHRDVLVIDIANDNVSSKVCTNSDIIHSPSFCLEHEKCPFESSNVLTLQDYKETEDPSKFKSEKTGRGPLASDWKTTTKPVMTCYKLVTVEFKWFGLQNKVESFIQKTERRIFLNFHRQVFCWIDRWHGMTIQDIRDIEEKTKAELDDLRKRGSIRGTAVED